MSYYSPNKQANQLTGQSSGGNSPLAPYRGGTSNSPLGGNRGGNSPLAKQNNNNNFFGATKVNSLSGMQKSSSYKQNGKMQKSGRNRMNAAGSRMQASKRGSQQHTEFEVKSQKIEQPQAKQRNEKIVKDPIRQILSNCKQEQQDLLAKEGLDQYWKAMGSHKGGQEPVSIFQQTCKELGTAKDWKDPEFPPEFKSLAGENAVERGTWQQYQWKTPAEIFGTQYSVFKGIDPNDIAQGQLGDCYFLAALSALAEKKERILKIFDMRTKKEKNKGLFNTTDANNQQSSERPFYMMNVNDDGEWTQQKVDARVPCEKSWNNETNKEKWAPAFSACPEGEDNEIWVMLMEKMWAKNFGSYDIIEGGICREVLRDFTGASTKSFFSDDVETDEDYITMFNKIKKADERNYIMCAGTGDIGASNTLNTDLGLVSGHAYSLLGTFDFTGEDGEQVMLLQIRNPWGVADGEWAGSWSDDDAKWNRLPQDVQEKLQQKISTGAILTKKDKGVFFMEIHDFIKYFQSFQICYIHDEEGYQYKSIKCRQSKTKATYFKIKTPEKYMNCNSDEKGEKYFLTINQKSKRKYPDIEEFHYAKATIIIGEKVARTDDDNGCNYKYIEGNSSIDKETWIKPKLKHNTEYIVYTNLEWEAFDEEDFVFSVYALHADATEITEEVPSQAHQFLQRVYKNYVQRMIDPNNGETKPAKQLKKKQNFAGKASLVIDKAEEGFMFIYGENDLKREDPSYKDIYTCTFTLQLQNIELMKPYSGNIVKMKLPPGTSEIAVLRCMPGQANFGVSSSISKSSS